MFSVDLEVEERQYLLHFRTQSATSRRLEEDQSADSCHQHVAQGMYLDRGT